MNSVAGDTPRMGTVGIARFRGHESGGSNDLAEAHRENTIACLRCHLDKTYQSRGRALPMHFFGDLMEMMLEGYYKYKGKLYLYVDTIKMKHPATRQWVDAVVYRDCNDPRSGVEPKYVREKADFVKKFKRFPSSEDFR